MTARKVGTLAMAEAVNLNLTCDSTSGLPRLSDAALADLRALMAQSDRLLAEEIGLTKERNVARDACEALAAMRDRAEAERDRLRAALDDCAHRARRIMGSIGYQDDDNSAWIGPDMHAILDHANREGVKP